MQSPARLDDANTDLVRRVSLVRDVSGPSFNASVLHALGHGVSFGTSRFTMETTASVEWRAPHPYAGMAEPAPDFANSLDAVLRLMAGQFPNFRLVHLGKDAAEWSAEIRGGQDGTARVPGDLPPCRAVLAALLRALGITSHEMRYP